MLKCPHCGTENPKLDIQCIIQDYSSYLFSADNGIISKTLIEKIYPNYLWCSHCRGGVKFENGQLVSYYTKTKPLPDIKPDDIKYLLKKLDKGTLTTMLNNLKEEMKNGKET